MALKVNTQTSTMQLTLPLFITKKNKYLFGSLMFLFAIVLYLITNHLHMFQPKFLPITWIDSITPFLPYSVWIYVSEYLLFAIVYILCRNIENLNKYFYSFVTLQLVSALIFWLWPTTYPRGQFPLPSNLDPLTWHLFTNLRVADTAANCAPSLHVSAVYISAFVFLQEQKKKFPLFFIWATAVAISTLTTKQHYLVDVVTGLILAVLLYWVFYYLISYRPHKEYT